MPPVPPNFNLNHRLLEERAFWHQNLNHSVEKKYIHSQSHLKKLREIKSIIAQNDCIFWNSWLHEIFAQSWEYFLISTLCKNAAEKMHWNVLVLMANSTVAQIYWFSLRFSFAILTFNYNNWKSTIMDNFERNLFRFVSLYCVTYC